MVPCDHHKAHPLSRGGSQQDNSKLCTPFNWNAGGAGVLAAVVVVVNLERHG